MSLSFIDQMRALLERILNAANDEDREQAEYEMAQFIKQHYRPEPRDFKMDQAHDEQT